MRYLRKTSESEILKKGWVYSKSNASRNRKIRKLLQSEQRGFCAYSEKWCTPTTAVEVEHFDPRIKYEDDYWNYYAVLGYLNRKKPNKIADFEPMLSPYSDDLESRITFTNWEFQPIDDDDVEASNLIQFLGVNSPEVHQERKNHVERLLDLCEMIGEDKLIEILLSDVRQLSFMSAIEHHINIDHDELASKTRH